MYKHWILSKDLIVIRGEDETTESMDGVDIIGPYFDANIPHNVTAIVGKSAFLRCRAKNLGNKTLAWIRHRDIHILTVGAYTYTSDQRFQATYNKDLGESVLEIKWASIRDAGLYVSGIILNTILKIKKKKQKSNKS